MQYQNKNANIANFFWGGEISSYELSNFLSFKDFGFSEIYGPMMSYIC